MGEIVLRMRNLSCLHRTTPGGGGGSWRSLSGLSGHKCQSYPWNRAVQICWYEFTRAFRSSRYGWPART